METKALAKPEVSAKGSALTFDNIESLQRLANYLHASKMLPKQYDTPEKIGTGIQYAVQLGFRDSWLLAIRQIAVINGTPSMFGDLPLALVRGSGLLEEFDEFLFDKDGTRISLENKNINVEFYGACCRLKRKGFPAVEKVFTVNDAKTAGVWGRNVWLPYPKRMIQMRTRSIALKDEFADILSGMGIGEYDNDTILEKVVESTVVSSSVEPLTGASKLNALAAKGEAIEVIGNAVEETIVPDPDQTGEFANFSGGGPLAQASPESEPEPEKQKSKAELVSEMFDLAKKCGMSMKDITARCKKDFGKEPAKMAEKDLEILNFFLADAFRKATSQ